MYYKRKLLILFLALAAFFHFVVSLTVAQSPKSLADFKPQFALFKIPGGADKNRVNSVLQDTFGFMWFATYNGLVRYDGHFFKSYNYNANDSNSISQDHLEWLYLDRQGKIWIGTFGGGLNCFNPATEKFTRYYHNSNNPNSISDNYVTSVVEDPAGFIWIGTRSGLDRLNPENRAIKHFKHNKNESSSISNNEIWSLYVDKQGTLWVGTGYLWDDTAIGGGLCRYNREKETFTCYLHNPKNPTTISGNKVRALLEDSKGNFWVGTEGDGVNLMNRQNGTFKRMPLNTDFSRELPNGSRPIPDMPTQVHTFLEDRNGNIWIGNVEGGLSIYEPSTSMIRRFPPRKKDNTTIENDFIWQLFQSSDGTIWIATGDFAQVFRVVEDKNYLSIYASLDTAGLYGITSFCYEDNNRLWIGAYGSTALNLYDLKKGVIARYEPQEVNGLFDISYIFRDKEGLVWITALGSAYALEQFNPITRTFTHYGKIANKQYLADTYGEVGTPNILQDKRGNIWCVAGNNTLLKLDKKTNQISQFEHSMNKTSNIDDRMFTIFEDKAGKIWVSGSYQQGKIRYLNRFDPELATWTSFIRDSSNGRAEIYSICQDANDKIWFSMINRGIGCLQPSSGKIEYYNTGNERLPANNAGNILLGLDNQLYISFGNTLIRMNPATGAWYAIEDIEATQKEIYSKGFRAPNGTFFYPLNVESAFLMFSPEKWAADNKKHASKVRLTDFALYNKIQKPGEKGVLQQPIWSTKQLRLSHHEEYFTFQFSTFNFRNTSSIPYEFMLEGYDTYWRKTQGEPSATYVKVPAGSYTFRVRMADNEKSGKATEASIRVIVHPPWWRTWWAYSGYVLVAAGLIFALYRFQLNRRLAEAEAQRLQELDNLKTRLYTNITHEFRTPLTIILGMARQVLDDPKNYFRQGLDMILRSGQNLLNLVNQMLDLAKLESGKMPLHFIQGNIISYLKYLVESFHSFAASQQIQIHFLSDLDELYMDFDEEKLQQIVSNLLSNAIKFTPEGGHVYLEVRTTKEEVRSTNDEVRFTKVKTNVLPTSYLRLCIRDTGVGIAEAALPHIFDRFYQADDSPTRTGEGTGIGLALVKELIKLMEGTIQVKSKIGQGSEFIVTLPIRQEAPELTPLIANEIVTSPFKTPILPAIETSNENNKPNILIIEDNADVVAYLATCLQNSYHIQVGKDGQEGIDIAIQNIPDLIITDVMMPYKDGFEVCQTLKNDERTSHIPIIMLTAKADMTSKLEGLERGADEYLAKPFHKEELLVRIRKLLELRQKLQNYYLAAAGLTENATITKDIPTIDTIEDTFVKKVRQAVEEHLDDADFNVEALCKAMIMSHSQLHRKLSALTGFSANTFIRYVRLTKAKELLRNPAITITAVAFDTGFNDPSYFGRVFKQEFGVTPQEWREHHLNSTTKL
ncbi:MAG: two-component regulator propeller domain-containing protein [Saprospiraceae bacterium]|nr:two-component regulator propeller domain-containing protein [Saprospiraceae bacterium]